jgi:hypothetical protein
MEYEPQLPKNHLSAKTHQWYREVRERQEFKSTPTSILTQNKIGNGSDYFID